MERRIAGTIVHEIRQMLPPTLFFLVCLNLLVLTVTLLSDRHEASAISHAAATVGALLLGKAFLLAEMLPVVNRYQSRPLIYGTLWKALLYYAAALALHLAERAIGVIAGGYQLILGPEARIHQVDWSHFAAVQMWLAILIVIYVASRELVRAIGPERIYQLFFLQAPPSSGAPSPPHGAPPPPSEPSPSR